MKRWVIFFLFVFLTKENFSQNLVPNPSFEDTIPCATWGTVAPGPITDWFCPNSSTPDWFILGGSCDGVAPSNPFGFQYARTGVAYCGFNALAFYPVALVSSREYIACKLTQTLQANKKYCVGFYVSPGDSMKYFIDGVGAYLSADTPTCMGNYCLLQYTPQIENPAGNILSDNVNWTLVKGNMIATGNEKFITIGNFTPDSLLVVMANPSSNDPNGTSYFYIDDVFVEEMVQADTANAGGDKLICADSSTQIGTVPCNGCIYSWQPATGLSDTVIAQPIATPAQTTTYILTVRDINTGTLCDWTSTDTVTVYVDPPCPPEQPVEIYNIFTPNGDGKNDFFFIKNLSANSALQIFNRWGGRVYQSSNYNNQWNGDGVPDGTYYYILVLPTKERYHGFVEIRR